MEKTKILYIITSLGIGGAEKLLLYYLKNLDKNKYSLNVCCLREKPDDLYLEILKYAAVINLKIKNKFNPIAVLFIFKLFRKIRPDIIHTHLFQPRIYASIAHLFYRRAVLITHKHSIVNPKKHNVFILFELLSIRINKKVIAISESVKNSLTKYEFVPENKIFVLPNCIDYQKYHNGKIRESISNKKELVIGTVGRLEPEKGLNYLLLAMKIILTRFPTVKLDIIGDGSALSELKNLSSKLNISNSVNFLGKFVDVIPFYNRMDIFVLPSILEGFGIVLLEAMAAGIPIVATNVDGIREVVINMRSGLLVPPKSPKAIADAITNLIDNPQLRTNLVQEGLIRAKEFDVKAHVMKLDSLYTNLLGVDSNK